MNRDIRETLMMLVCAYIAWLGIRILGGYTDGTGTMPAWAALLFGFGFLIVGGGLILRYLWKLLRERRNK